MHENDKRKLSIARLARTLNLPTCEGCATPDLEIRYGNAHLSTGFLYPAVVCKNYPTCKYILNHVGALDDDDGR